jgi:hypothetical protein
MLYFCRTRLQRSWKSLSFPFLFPLIFFFSVARAWPWTVSQRMTVSSPKGTFRLVQEYQEGEPYWHWRTWVEEQGGKRYLLAENDPETYQRYPAQYSISPDEQWIFRQQKWASGESVAYLYRRDSKTGKFRKVNGRFDQKAWDFYCQLARKRGWIIPNFHKSVYVEADAWARPKVLRFGLFGARDEGGSSSETSVQLCYDLGSGSLSECPSSLEGDAQEQAPSSPPSLSEEQRASESFRPWHSPAPASAQGDSNKASPPFPSATPNSSEPSAGNR